MNKTVRPEEARSLRRLEGRPNAARARNDDPHGLSEPIRLKSFLLRLRLLYT